VHVGGDFARDASGERVGRSAFKKGSISRAVDMPRSSCDYHALPPSGPPNGVHRCSLEGSASRLSLPTTSSPESSCSWWCRRSCLLLAAVGGAQPRGGWRSSTIIRLQGLWWREASRAAASPCPQLQGCSSSALGKRASRVGVPPSAWAGGPLLPSAFEGEGRSPALRRRRTPGKRSRPSEAPSAASCLVPRPGWLWCCLRRCLLPLGWGMAVRPPHG
jgi:hypothetical protein